ncbi:hypothetical protein EV644_110167 [Kribbella orskensis]|uniref:Uncharacterized protein n=1 Tax=Kribbella orskensis TaxID=2512216 RepID=A0ABY2BGK2_9ACTN|nr:MULTISPECIES: hypothetical protein [Kribbella]TCN38032.1 hypothetical protein EV642_110189 [Kribbella sp. VKM Ac-2500]TCO19519.1 hypothetical protein EV644_110167 [Kribbella orskensis]
MTKTPFDPRQVLDLVEDLLPVLLPDADLDPAGPLVKLHWSRGGLSSSAEVGLVELIDRCREQPNHLWPRTVDEWLHGVVEEIGVATDEHLYGDVAARQRATLRPTGWAAATGGVLADLTVPFGRYFEIVFGIQSGSDWRRLTQVRRVMHGLHLPDRPSGLDLTLDGLTGLTFQPVDGVPWSVLHRPGDPTVGMALVDHERLLPKVGAGRGALLAVPASDLLAVCRVDRRDDMQRRADEFARWVYQVHLNAEDPCTAGVFWLVGDLLAELPVDPLHSPAVLLPKPLQTPVWRRWSRLRR